MFEYLLMIFGINFNHKSIANFFTGFSLTIFTVLMIRISLLLKISDNFEIFSFKTLSLTICFSNLFSYLIIKFKSRDILKLYFKMKDSRNDVFINSSINYPSITSTVVWLLLTVIFTLLRFTDHRIEENCGSIVFPKKGTFLPISSRFVFIFYFHSWKLMLQLIYHQLYTRYSKIIKNFNCELKRKLSSPDLIVIQMTNRTVLRFIRYQTLLRKNVDFIKYFIIFDIITMSLFFASWNSSTVSVSDRKCFVLSMSYIVVMLSNNLWIYLDSIQARIAEQDLKLNLKKWQNYLIKENCIIPFKVLQTTVHLFLHSK
jgi:hypothetical protein